MSFYKRFPLHFSSLFGIKPPTFHFHAELKVINIILSVFTLLLIMAMPTTFTLTLFSKEVGVTERELLDLLGGGGGGGGGAFVLLLVGWSRRLLMLLLLRSELLLGEKSRVRKQKWHHLSCLSLGSWLTLGQAVEMSLPLDQHKQLETSLV